MTYITADAMELLHQASMTAHDYMSEAVDRIDRVFGAGYAQKNPALVGAFMQAASMDMGAATIAKAVGEAIEELARASRRDNGSDEIASALIRLATAVESIKP